jgi:hypothetical protein
MFPQNFSSVYETAFTKFLSGAADAGSEIISPAAERGVASACANTQNTVI